MSYDAPAKSELDTLLEKPPGEGRVVFQAGVKITIKGHVFMVLRKYPNAEGTLVLTKRSEKLDI